MNATTVTQKENYFSVATNCTEIRIFFLTDHIIRIRAGFDGDFAEERRNCLRRSEISGRAANGGSRYGYKPLRYK